MTTSLCLVPLLEGCPTVFGSINFLYENEDVHQSMEELDSICPAALHHACDHCGWSGRICKAAKQLASESPPHVINTWSLGYAKYRTPLLFVCDGASRYWEERCSIAQELINRGAKIEWCDQHGNTPFLIAASAGFIPMFEVLVAAGARTHAKNYACVGARGRCVQSSSSTHAYSKSLWVYSPWRNDPPDVVRGKSNGASQQTRMARTKTFGDVEKFDTRA